MCQRKIEYGSTGHKQARKGNIGEIATDIGRDKLWYFEGTWRSD